MRIQETRVLKHKLKELGELYQELAEEAHDPESRTVSQMYIDNLTADIIEFVHKEIDNAVAEERANHV